MSDASVKNSSQRKIGAILSFVATGLNAVLSLVYVPILIYYLTTSEYGVYELIGSMIGYLAILDLGFSNTLTRFCVRERQRGGDTAESNLLAIAGIVYGTLTVIAVIAAIVIDLTLDYWLDSGFTAEELALSHDMMKLVIINCAVILPGNYFLSIINSYERFIISRACLILRYILQFLGVLFVVLAGEDAVGVVAAQVLANGVTVLLSSYYCFAHLRMHPRLIEWNLSLVGEMFSFSFFVLLSLICTQIFMKTGQVILGAVIGSFAVAVYSISCKIASFYCQVANSVSTVFLPKLTVLVHEGGNEVAINTIFQKVGRIQAILVWGILGGFIICGPEFIDLWAGSDFREAYYAALILMFGYSIDLVQNVGIQLLQANGKLAFRSVLLLITAITDVVLCVLVAADYGPIGCAAVTAILFLIASGPIMNVYYKKRAAIDLKSFWRAVFPIAAVILICVTVCIVTCNPLEHLIDNPGYMLAIKAFSFCILYGFSLWTFAMNAYEKGLVGAVFGKIVRRST